MADPKEVDRVLVTIALSLAVDDAEKALDRALGLSRGLVSIKSQGRMSLANALVALTTARTLLQDELKDG